MQLVSSYVGSSSGVDRNVFSLTIGFSGSNYQDFFPDSLVALLSDIFDHFIQSNIHIFIDVTLPAYGLFA